MGKCRLSKDTFTFEEVGGDERKDKLKAFFQFFTEGLLELLVRHFHNLLG
jgi:hypothetical protein